jgi:hypothetical protein
MRIFRHESFPLAPLSRGAFSGTFAKRTNPAENAGRFAATRETVSACSRKKRGENCLKGKYQKRRITPRETPVEVKPDA